MVRGHFIRAVPGDKLSYIVRVGSRVKHVWSGRGAGPAFLFLGQCPVTNCRTLCVSAVESNTCGRAAERVRLFCGESPLTSSCLMDGASRKASGNRPTGRWLTLGVWGRTCWLVLCQREGSQCLAVNKKEPENPTQHSYHITARISSQWQNAPARSKSVACTKTDVCIWETFRLEKLEIP